MKKFDRHYHFYERYRMREAERYDDDGYGVETIIHGQCRSTIRGTPGERLKWLKFFNELRYVPNDPRYGRAEIR